MQQEIAYFEINKVE